VTILQSLIRRCLPSSWADAIQAESESWLLRCPSCGAVRSVWEIGGVRYKAASLGMKVLVRCAQCGQTHMMPLERKL
jgi:uncharacterized Zn finger protein